MPDDLSVAVERLRASSHRLNTISDTAAHVIQEAEAFLEECRIGLPACIEVSRVDETGHGHFTLTNLAYERWKGKFRILVIVIPCDAECPEDEIIRPWSEATRDEKIESLGKLPELLVELSKQVEERTTKAEQAVSGVSSLLKLSKRKGGA